MKGEATAPAPHPEPSTPAEWAERVHSLPPGSEEQFRAFQQFLRALDEEHGASA